MASMSKMKPFAALLVLLTAGSLRTSDAFAPSPSVLTLSSRHNIGLGFARETTRSERILMPLVDDDDMVMMASRGESGVSTPGSSDCWNINRADFLRSTSAAAAAAALTIMTAPITPADARGRATLEQSYDRYTPRIIAGGQFFANDLRKLIERNDWEGIKAATAEPPKKKTKADLAKVDAGIAERAAKAGGFSDSRVLVAADLYAGAFSDNSISAKTKKMRDSVQKLRAVVEGMNLAAKEALGEEKGGGGLFGFGAKKPTQTELAKKVRELYVAGGNYWNQYIFDANDELPITLQKLPYL